MLLVIHDQYARHHAVMKPLAGAPVNGK